MLGADPGNERFPNRTHAVTKHRARNLADAGLMRLP